MPSIKVENLQPGQNYQVQVYTIKTLPDGTTEHSANSQAISLTAPGKAASGSNFSNTNTNSDTQISGGSIFAGTFPSNSGNLDIINDDKIEGTGVILNQYGIAGFANGVKEFWIDASTGKAYFAGNVTAGTVKIGPGVNSENTPTIGTPAGTKDGIYINDTNYWYSDGSWQARFTDIAGALTNKKPDGSLIFPDAPTWDLVNTKWAGSTLNLVWTFDNNGANNHFAKDFVIEFTIGSFSKKVIVPLGTNSYSLNVSQNKALFGVAATSFDSITILTEDTFGNQSTSASSLSPIPTYTSSLSAPTIIGVSPINNGYVVNYAPSTDPTLFAISIEETTTSAIATDFKAVYSGPGVKDSADVNYSATIVAADLNTRWVKARFYDEVGGHSPYSSVYNVTPTSPVVINNTAPTDVTIVSSTFTTINGLANSGEDIQINVTLPNSNYGQTFIVKLTPDSKPSSNAYFYFTRNASTGTSQSFTITKQEAFLQLGGYFSSFKGNITSVSDNGIKSNSPPSFVISTRVTSLSDIDPTSTSKVIAIADGYTATFNFANTPATSAEIYQKYTSWSGITNPADNFTGTYVANSGGAQGSSTLVIDSVVNEDGETVTSIPTGYPISGTGIPAYTYVSAVSGSGPFTLTLSNALTAQASGTYSLNSLSYSGTGPAVVYTTNYVPIYVIVRYYDDFGNASKPSSETTITPINPGAITSFQNAVNIAGTNGSVYVGTSPAVSGSRVILSGNGNSTNPTGFSGLFAYDNSNNITTRILANPTGGAYTFATTSAHIADWNITSSKIENTITTPSNGTYTGLSGSGTYAFWAGSSASGGNSSANFSVTPAGAVVARKISIIGDGTTSDLINAAGLFKVTNAGALEATSAKIKGQIEATTGTFSGDVIIGATGSIYSKNVVPSTSNGQGFILNQNGLRFNSSSVNGITTINGSTGQLYTRSADIGGWLINDSLYANAIYASSNNSTMLIDSANNRISASTTNNGGYYVGLATPQGPGGVVLWAGNAGVASTTNAFYVTSDGVLNATGAKISGEVVITSGTTKTALDNATSKANAALPSTSFNRAAIVSQINSTTANPTNTTKIDGGTIITGTISADAVVADFITAFSINADKITSGTLTGRDISGGTISIGSTGSDFLHTNYPRYTPTNLYGPYYGLGINAIAMISSSTAGVVSNWYPFLDAESNLGLSGTRWVRLYATNTSISTSDVRTKKNIQKSDLGLDFINDLIPSKFIKIYKTDIPLMDGDNAVLDSNGNRVIKETVTREGARYHYGLIAQEVKQALDKHGVGDQFAGWALDEPNNPDSRQGLAYEDFISPLIKAVQELSNKIDILESRLDGLTK
jgi:hypothetical protein